MYKPGPKVCMHTKYEPDQLLHLKDMKKKQKCKPKMLTMKILTCNDL